MLEITAEKILSYHIDYVRFHSETDADDRYINIILQPAIGIPVTLHGVRFLDFGGDALAQARMMGCDIIASIRNLDVTHTVSRLDLCCDVLGNVISKELNARKGTLIVNDGRIETIYSSHLKERGNVGFFGRVYDAQSAGHYAQPVTRFELEIKRRTISSLLCATHNDENLSLWPVFRFQIMSMFDVDIKLPNTEPIEFDPPKTVLESDRERFYRRFGQGILRDVECMSVDVWLDYVIRCVLDRKEKIC